MAKLKINGVEVEINDSIAPMVKTVIDENETLKTNLSDSQATAEATQAKLDASEDKVTELKKSQLSDADIQAKAESLVAVWKHANMLDAEFDCKGKSESEIKCGVVLAKLGDSVKDKPESYMETRFDIMVEDATADAEDPLSQAFKDANPGSADIIDANKARQESIERKQNAWKNKA